MPDTKREFYNVCPTCWSVRVKARLFKSPRYKCENCGTEFPNKKRISYQERNLFNKVLKLARDNAEGLKTFNEIKLRTIAVKNIKRYLNG